MLFRIARRVGYSVDGGLLTGHPCRESCRSARLLHCLNYTKGDSLNTVHERAKEEYRRVKEIQAKQAAGEKLTQVELNILYVSPHGYAAGCGCKK